MARPSPAPNLEALWEAIVPLFFGAPWDPDNGELVVHQGGFRSERLLLASSFNATLVWEGVEYRLSLSRMNKSRRNRIHSPIDPADINLDLMLPSTEDEEDWIIRTDEDGNEVVIE